VEIGLNDGEEFMLGCTLHLPYIIQPQNGIFPVARHVGSTNVKRAQMVDLSTKVKIQDVLKTDTVGRKGP
jgi:hypothetical protein